MLRGSAARPPGAFPSPTARRPTSLALPIYGELTADQQRHVVASIAEFYARPPMKLLVLVLGAGGQLGEAMADAARRPSTRSSRSRARELDVTDGRRGRATPSRRALPGRHRQLRGVHRTWTAPRAIPLQALAVNAWAVRTLARAAARRRRHARALQHRLRLRRHDRPAVRRRRRAESARHVRDVEAARRVVRGRGAAPLRAARREPVRRPAGAEQRRPDPRRHSAPARKSARSPIAPSRRATSTTSSTATRRCSSDGSPSGLYHCVNTGWTTWAGLARELARLVGRPDARIAEVPMADAGLIAPRPKFAALSNAKLAAAGHRDADLAGRARALRGPRRHENEQSSVDAPIGSRRPSASRSVTTISATISPIARLAVSPGESMPAA